MNKKPNIAIAGATGAVGQEILKVLEKRKFPVGDLRLLASKNSVGKKIKYMEKDLDVEELTTKSFKNIDIALFSAGGGRSKEFAPAAVKSGAVVIDNSSAFRMDKKVPLIIPEINPEDISTHEGIIANPNCSTIIMLMAVWPIYKLSRIKMIFVATYQSASGAGARAMEELETQTGEHLKNKKVEPKVFKHPIAFNLFSHDSKIDDQGYTQEEMKMVGETKKIFHDEKIHISPTTIRVPLLRSHAEVIHLELEEKVSIDRVREAINQMPGIKLVDNRDDNYFPMPVDASGKDEVLVGRIRKDLVSPTGINRFVCGDQLLKGAALNAVQIAEKLIS